MVKHVPVVTRTKATRDMQYLGQMEVMLTCAVMVFLRVVISCSYNLFLGELMKEALVRSGNQMCSQILMLVKIFIIRLGSAIKGN